MLMSGWALLVSAKRTYVMEFYKDSKLLLGTNESDLDGYVLKQVYKKYHGSTASKIR